MRALFILFIIFNDQIIFSLLSFFGIQYQGIEESSLLIIVSVVILFGSILMYFFDLLTTRRVTFNELIIFLLLCLLLLASLLSGTQYIKYNERHVKAILLFGVRVIPAVLAALYVRRNKILPELVRYGEWISIMMTLMLIKNVGLLLLTKSSFNAFRSYGISYQEIGYIGATSFGITLYYICNGGSNYVQGLRYLFLLVQGASVIISGARGALVLLSVFTLILFVYLLRPHRKVKFNHWGIRLFGLCILFAVFRFGSELQTVQKGMERLGRGFEFSDLFHYIEVSGRSEIYRRTFELISMHPLFGQGISSFYYTIGVYPHNLFFEFALEGGVFYLLLWCYLLTHTVVRMVMKYLHCREIGFVMTIFLSAMIMLLFSGSYFTSEKLWFVIVFMMPSTIKQGTLKLEGGSIK